MASIASQMMIRSTIVAEKAQAKIAQARASVRARLGVAWDRLCEAARG